MGCCPKSAVRLKILDCVSKVAAPRPHFTLLLAAPPPWAQQALPRLLLLSLLLLLHCLLPRPPPLSAWLRARPVSSDPLPACPRAPPGAQPYTLRLRPAHFARPRSYGNVFTRSGHRLWAFRNVAGTDQEDFHDRFVHVLPPGDRRPPAGFGAQGALGERHNAYLGAGGAFATAFFDAEEDGDWVDTGLDTARVACAVAPDAVFLVLDTAQDTAFGHWVGESAVFLYLWADLSAQHPGIRLVLRSARTFKALLAAAWGLRPAQLLVARALPHNASNLVYFAPLFLLNSALLDLGLGARAFAAHMQRVRSHAGLGGLCGNWGGAGAARLLLMPRGSRENFFWNDRAVPHEREVMAHFNGTRGAQWLFTDEVRDIGEQARAVAGARVIVTHYGSALFFNGAIARNATLVVLGSLGEQHKDVHGFRAMWRYINLYNRVVVVEPWLNAWDIIPLVEKYAAEEPPLLRACEEDPYFAPLPGGERGV